MEEEQNNISTLKPTNKFRSTTNEKFNHNINK